MASCSISMKLNAAVHDMFPSDDEMVLSDFQQNYQWGLGLPFSFRKQSKGNANAKFQKKNANPVQAILSWLNCLRCDRSSRVPDDRCQSFGRRSRCRQIDVYARWREVLVCSFLSVCDNNTILAGVRKLTFRLLVVSSDVCHLLTITIKQARHLLFYGLWLNKLSRSFSQHQSLQFFLLLLWGQILQLSYARQRGEDWSNRIENDQEISLFRPDRLRIIVRICQARSNLRRSILLASVMTGPLLSPILNSS